MWALDAVAAATAQVTEDAQGAKDHPLVSRYPGSHISEYQAVEFDEFTLPLARVKDDGSLEKSQHVEGKITRLVYDVPAGRSLLAATQQIECLTHRAARVRRQRGPHLAVSMIL